MRKKTRNILILATIVCAALMGLAWLVAYPMTTVKSQRECNLVLTTGDGQVLATAAPYTLLYNRWWPDRDTRHGKAMVRRPAEVDSTSLYPVIVVTQAADEQFDELARQWPMQDSCYVLIVSANVHLHSPTAPLHIVVSRLISHLNRSGMRIDPNDITLVDRTADGRQAQQFGPHRVRQLIVTSATLDTNAHAASRVHLVPSDAPTATRMAASFGLLMAHAVDADLYPSTPLSALPKLAHEIAVNRRPISQSRLRFTHQQAMSRGYNQRYVMFVDFSIPSGKNRFFLYDYDHDRIAVASKCAHGCGSGSTDATPQFSNEHGSNATSLGLYEINDIHRMYKNGRVAINLEGLEATNNNARMRGIKVHGGMSHEGEIYPRYLRIGKLSEGCFALSNIPLASVLVIVDQVVPSEILLSAYTH